MKFFLVLFGTFIAVAVGQECPTGKLGSLQNPASSCKAIFDNNWGVPPSGAYYIKVESNVDEVYCYMDVIPECGGGGWTTVMKTNGNLSTFGYDSPYWTNKVAYNVDGGLSGEDNQETKLPTYWSTTFTRLCLGMKTGLITRWISVDYG